MSIWQQCCPGPPSRFGALPAAARRASIPSATRSIPPLMMVRLFKHRASIDAVKLLSVALAYFVCGRLGLALPSVDSHITLIWLPTGIAVAALLRWGYIWEYSWVH
ncbi:MAG: hypothetical protein ACYCY7_00395 [Gallionella sp.]